MAKTDKPDYLAPDHQLDVILKAIKLLEYDLAGVQKMIKTWQEDGYGDYKTKGSNQADKDRYSLLIKFITILQLIIF